MAGLLHGERRAFATRFDQYERAVRWWVRRLQRATADDHRGDGDGVAESAGCLRLAGARRLADDFAAFCADEFRERVYQQPQHDARQHRCSARYSARDGQLGSKRNSRAGGGLLYQLAGANTAS